MGNGPRRSRILRRAGRIPAGTVLLPAFLCLSAAGAVWAEGTNAGPASVPGSRLVFHQEPGQEAFGMVDLVDLPAATLAALAGPTHSGQEKAALFACYTEEAAARAGWPAVVGTYRVVGRVYRFTPRYPFAGGNLYVCRADGEAMEQPPAPLTFTMPSRPEDSPARVVAVYPAGDEVPANLLRLYVHFSRPMWPKDVAQHVRIQDRDGRRVEMPFVEVANGLWDPEARRLTLLLHPGRIKRGVAPRAAMGPPLRAGESYRLVIGTGLRDAGGQPLAAAFHHEFKVVAADRRSPDPGEWALVAPRQGDSPLTLRFPEPLDHALLGRLLSVRHASGAEVAGRVMVRADGGAWSFTPASPWRTGRYLLVVNPALEDLAGNTPVRLFDEEEPAPGRDSGEAARLELGFSFPAP